MARKFSELADYEQIHFRHLSDFMKETWNEDIGIKIDIIKRFDLDIKDSVVLDFLTDVYMPKSPKKRQQDYSSEVEPILIESPHITNEQLLPITTIETNKQVEKTNKREMTYANSENLIVIQNRLLHAISNLTLNERRLILFLSPIVRKNVEQNPSNRVFYVLASDFANEYKLKGKSVYFELKKAAESIIEKAFFFWYKTKNGKAKKGVSWVSECDYVDNEARIKVRLDNTVIEMLTVFDKTTGNFWTQYQKEWIINLGAYGIVMLEMVLSSQENKGCYTIEHLREKFDCVDSYPVFADFKRYVIDKAIKEIHKHTPIKIFYEVNRFGRSVKSVNFSYINTSKSIQDNTKDDEIKPKEINPFINFKMTQKQLSLFATKIKKATGQDIDEIISELCNVHLQFKHIDFLKVLDYVPSDWYSDDEIKSHLTAEQITQDKIDKKNQAKAKKQQKQERLKADMDKLIAHAEIFVKANLNKVGKTGIERIYLQQKNYIGIVRAWERHLLDETTRQHFSMIDDILQMP